MNLRHAKVLILGLLHSGYVLAANQTAITEGNWERHPDITEIRSIYNDIKMRITNKEFAYREKRSPDLPASCFGTYPFEKFSIATDKEKRVRFYATAQRVSHGDLLTTENYFDVKGKLRFVFISTKSKEFSSIEKRVYLNEQGEVIWDVRKEAANLAFGQIKADPYMIREKTGMAALKNFDSPCSY